MRAIANIWYGELVGADLIAPPPRRRWDQFWAGWSTFRAARDAELVVTSEGRIGPPGLVVLAGLLALTGRRTLAVMEFLPGRKTGILGTAVALAYRAFLPRACVFVQAMTHDEVGAYERLYRIPADVIRFVPYYFRDERLDRYEGERRGVFSSGRQSCDWPTLLTAADGQDWDLTIVCSAEDAAGIADHAARVGATVLVDIPRAEHDEALARSTVCVVSILDTPVSAGHTRLMTAASVGTPAILTDARGSKDYRALASVLVPPGDPVALRRAIGEALADPASLNRACARAAVAADAWTRSDYAAALRSALESAAGRARPKKRTRSSRRTGTSTR